MLPWTYETSLLLFGMGTIAVLWLMPLAHFRVLVPAVTVMWLINAYHLMGEARTVFGVVVPSGTMVSCMAASMVGLTAARLGTGDARWMVEIVCGAFLIAFGYEALLAITGRVPSPQAITYYTQGATNALLTLLGFYLYATTFLMLRWFTSTHTRYKRISRALLGVLTASVIIYPVTVLAVYLSHPATEGLASIAGFMVRTGFHGVLVTTIMVMRDLFPKGIHYDV